jgi:hypothetical protein
MAIPTMEDVLSLSLSLRSAKMINLQYCGSLRKGLAQQVIGADKGHDLLPTSVNYFCIPCHTVNNHSPDLASTGEVRQFDRFRALKYDHGKYEKNIRRNAHPFFGP